MKTSVSAVALLALLLGACSAPNSDHAAYESSDPHAKMAAASADGLSADHTPDSALINQDNLPVLADKRLIIHGALTFDVKEVRTAAKTLGDLSAKLGGYVAKEEITNQIIASREVPIGNGQLKVIDTYQRLANLTVRIPKEKVDEFLQALQSQIDFLHAQEFSAEDVSLDIQKAQISAQIQALRSRSLDQASDDTALETVITADQAAQARLAKLASDIENKYLEDQVAFATLSLSFKEGEQMHTATKTNMHAVIAQERRVNFGARLGENFVAGWYGFLEFLLSLVMLWPMVFVLPIFWLIYKGLCRLFINTSEAKKIKKAQDKPAIPSDKAPDSDPPPTT